MLTHYSEWTHSAKTSAYWEKNLPLQATETSANLHALGHTVAHDEKYAQNVKNDNPSDKVSKYIPLATAAMIRTRHWATFCYTATTRVGQRKCELAANKEGQLARKAHID